MMMKVSEVLIVILLVVATSLSLIAAYKFINLESTVTLIFFNIFYASLVFQLKSALTKKALAVLLGNLVGIACNYFFYNLSYAGLNYFGPAYNAIDVLILPFLNLMWIVPFWSFSLSFLTEENNLRNK
jgi:hypothetical protein